jgi:hypothetical protein
MNEMKTLTQNEKNRVDELSYKIDNGTANVEEYKEYEKLLIQAGIPEKLIRARMNKYGYNTYEQYYDARKNAKTTQDKNVLEILIVVGLAVFSIVIGSLIATGRLIITEDSTKKSNKKMSYL